MSRRALLLVSAVAVLAFGFFIYSGIHSRTKAATNLQRTTEKAAVAPVVVIHPKNQAPVEEITLPGARSPTSTPPSTPAPTAISSIGFTISARE